MRQLRIQVPAGQGLTVTDVAEKHNPINISNTPSTTPDGTEDVVVLHVANDVVGNLLEDLSQLPEANLTLNPNEMLTMTPPDVEVADRLVNVKQRSPMEVWLNGLQSIGSWKSFLGYVLAASIVVWIGLFTNNTYLLVAAMLIAPFGGPAMNASLATASGDGALLKKSVLRYVVGLLVLILITFALSMIWQIDQVTNVMMTVGQISATAALLPIVTGGIGALNLIEPDRSSLVPGTAIGSLVAASLAPPAGVAGIALALQQWTLVQNALFILAMQLFFINFSGALVFHYYGGLTPQGSRYQRGRKLISRVSLALSLVVGIGLLWLQFQTTPSFERTTRAQEAAGEAAKVLNESELVGLVSANFRFTEPVSNADETLLGIIYAQRKSDILLPDAEIEALLTKQVQTRLLEKGFEVTPLISVTILSEP